MSNGFEVRGLTTSNLERFMASIRYVRQFMR